MDNNFKIENLTKAEYEFLTNTLEEKRRSADLWIESYYDILDRMTDLIQVLSDKGYKEKAYVVADIEETLIKEVFMKN